MVGTTTYMSTTTTSGAYEGCYTMTYTNPSSGFINQADYIADYSGTPVGYDIGYQSSTGYIWMATDNATSPLLCYENSSGDVLESIPASIGIGSDIRGVAFEGTSSQFIWVSNQTTNELYKIDLQMTGIEVNTSVNPSTSAEISCSENPFCSNTVVSLAGFTGNISVEVYDIQGRKVLSEVAESSIILNGQSLPSGSYLILATDEMGCSATSRVIKL